MLTYTSIQMKRSGKRILASGTTIEPIDYSNNSYRILWVIDLHINALYRLAISELDLWYYDRILGILVGKFSNLKSKPAKFNPFATTLKFIGE